MITKLKKMFLPIESDNLEVNDFIQKLIDQVAKIREKQIKNGVVDNKIMVFHSNNDKTITLQYYDVEIKEENIVII